MSAAFPICKGRLHPAKGANTARLLCITMGLHMSGATPTKIEREARRTEIARLYLMRLPQAEIGARVHVTQATVSRDLARIRQEWRESRAADFGDRLGEELARIDALEQTYWEAWRRSLDPKRTETTQQRQGESVEIAVTIRTDGSEGNPGFLAGIQWCISKRVEILGLGKPLRVAPTTPDGDKPWDGMPDDEKAARLFKVIRDAQHRALADGDATALTQHAN